MSSKRRKRQAVAKPVRAEPAARILQKEAPPSTSEVQAQPSALKADLFWLAKTTWLWVAALMSLYGTLTSLYSLRPKLEVQVSSLRENPSAALFTVTNNGTLSAHNVSIDCRFHGTILVKDNSISYL